MKRNGFDKLHLTAPLKPATRNHHRGRRPRRPFRRMTDGVGLLLNVTFRLVGRTVPGAPPSVAGRRRFRAPPHPTVRPALVDWRRCILCAHLPTRRRGLSSTPARRGLTGNVITSYPRCTNPSVTAQSAATAPLSGEPRGEWKLAAFTHLLTAMPIPTSRCHP